MNDMSKEFLFNKGKFLKCERMVPDEIAKKKEYSTPSPAAYQTMDSWKTFEPALHGNYKQ
jgi:hypothetical protein